MLKSVFVALPKITVKLDCSNHRTIILMNHIIKVSTEDSSSASETEKYTGNTWEPTWIHVRSRNQECNLHSQSAQQTSYLASTGSLHGFYWLQEGVQTKSDIKIFSKCWKKMQIDDKDLRVIRNLYNEQVAAVSMPEKSTTAWARIRKGGKTRMRNVTRSFNLHSKMILRELEDVDEGIVVTGVRINNIRYADDTALSLRLLKVYTKAVQRRSWSK